MRSTVQLGVNIDAFSIKLTVDPAETGRRVYAKRDEELDRYKVTAKACGSTSAPAAQKHCYYVVTMPGVGCLACVPFQSGCRNMPDPEDLPHNFYWYEQLVQRGIGDQEQEDKLKQHVWAVCTLS